jgi:hypothetical protein
MAIGRTPALDAKVKSLGLPGTIVARATLTLDADVSGATKCDALELVSLPFTVPVAFADIATFDSAAVCSALTAAVAAAGGALTDVAKTQCSLVDIDTTWTAVAKGGGVTSQVPQDPSTANFIVSVGVKNGAADKAAKAIASNIGTPSPKGRALEGGVSAVPREVVVRTLSRIRVAKPGPAKSQKIAKAKGKAAAPSKAKVSADVKKAKRCVFCQLPHSFPHPSLSLFTLHTHTHPHTQCVVCIIFLRFQGFCS